MEKATILCIMYDPSDTIEIQGKRKDIERYLNAGYYIKESRNGYWVLVKAARLNVTLSNSFGTRVINMKEDVCDYYGRQRISQSLIERFRQDTKTEKISVYFDSKGNYSLK